MSFEQLCRVVHLPTTHFFKYLQVRHFISKSQRRNSTSIKAFPIDKILKDIKHPRGILSLTYSRILALTETKPQNNRTTWEQDLDCTFADSEWESLCKEALTFSYNSRNKLLQFNLIHRTYFTPERLHRINDSISDLCPRCKIETGSLYSYVLVL